MPRHQFLDDPDRPTSGSWTPRAEHEVVAEMTARILALDIDANGNVHRRDVLDALTDDSSPG